MSLNTFSLVLYNQETAVNPRSLETYMAALNKEYMSPDERKKRAQSHIRQWYTMQKCGEHFEDLQSKGSSYDVLVRIRDDMSVLKHIHLNALSYSNKLLSLNCQVSCSFPIMCGSGAFFFTT